MLLGMYRCADVPGEFVWQPGSLTQAVMNGYWLLLEDIDYAPLDVVCTTSIILELRGSFDFKNERFLTSRLGKLEL